GCGAVSEGAKHDPASVFRSLHPLFAHWRIFGQGAGYIERRRNGETAMSKVTMPEPFMYGIMEPDGTPYFGELCVSGNKGDLDDDICDLNDGNEAGLYQEAAL